MTTYVYWIRGAEHAELAKLSIASVHKADIGARVLVYAEVGDAASTHEIPGCARGLIGSGRPAMVANLDAQLAAMRGTETGERIIFLDADTLLLKPMPFDEDLMVTWRDHVGVVNGEKVAGIARSMPYNYGVFGVRNSFCAYEALLWIRARILKMATEHQQWYGNQIALAELVGAPGTTLCKIPWGLEDEGDIALTVKQFPCETHNYTPEGPGEDVSGKFLLHFKGGRKDLMKAYA